MTKTTKSRIEQRRTVYEGRIFKVEVDRVHLPSGHTVDMDVVRHPGSVVLLPMPGADEVILIRQYRYTIDKWIWELPAGSLKPSENPDEAAARECEEEIGLFPDRVERLRSFYPTPGFCDEEMIFYRCTELRAPNADSTAKPDEDEDLEPRTFTVAEARRMIESGEIVDLKTAVGLTLIGGTAVFRPAVETCYCSDACCARFATFLPCGDRDAGNNASNRTSSMVLTR